QAARPRTPRLRPFFANRVPAAPPLLIFPLDFATDQRRRGRNPSPAATIRPARTTMSTTNGPPSEHSALDAFRFYRHALAVVNDAWFEHAVAGEALGRRVRLVPPEEMIWQKAYIMERERFDGADVLHLLRARGRRLDWPRLLARFGPHWRVLLSHLVLFGFV